ncbi:putative uncharacterized protein [Clostridium sp. CAG:58]|nr:putative uncharacterized protein [Clostridium sp. CAG:58]
MIKFERTSVMNLENAIRGARNPMNSWGRMDSAYDEDGNYILGPNDLDLAKRLRRAGSDHRKYVRQIFVSVDITAPPSGHPRPPVLVEGIRHLQGSHRGQFHQHHAQDPL